MGVPEAIIRDSSLAALIICGTFDQLAVDTLNVGRLTVKDLVIEHDTRD
jgi:hypothetical protein